MSVISIRLPDVLLHDLDKSAEKIKIKRAEYIRRAILQMNQDIAKNIRDNHIKNVSLRVRKESMLINREFSQIEDIEESDEENSR